MKKEGQGPRRRRAGSRSSDTQVSTDHTSQFPYKEAEGVGRDRGLEAALGPYLTVSWRCRQWGRLPRGGSPALGGARMQAWSSGQTWRGTCSSWSRTTARDEWATAPRTWSVRTSPPPGPQGAPQLQLPPVLGPREGARAAAPLLQREGLFQGTLGSDEALRSSGNREGNRPPGQPIPATVGLDPPHNHQRQEPSCRHG